MSSRLSAACGVIGPLLLVAYFATPFAAGWPFNGGSAAQIGAYADSHATLFFAGAWLQTIGTVLSVVFLLALLQAARAVESLAGLVVIIGCATLVGLVLVESALTAFVPVAASAGDAQSARTAFGLVNGVFAHVFGLAPASLPYLGLGAIIVRSRVIDGRFGYAATALGAGFQVAGLLAVFTPVGIVLVGILAAVQAIWVVSAAIAFGRM